MQSNGQLKPPAVHEVIMLVEDSPTQALKTRLILESVGYTVRICPNGAMALAHIAESPPDLILLDLNLPDISGQDVARRLKHDPLLSGIPIIFLTGFFREVQDIIHGLDQGADDYIDKDVENDELIARVRASLRTKRTQRELGRLARLLLTVTQVGNRLVDLQNRSTFPKSVVELIHENFEYPNVHLLLVEDRELVLRASAGNGSGDRLIAQPRIPLDGDGVLADVVNTCRLALVNSVEAESVPHPFLGNVRSFAAAPLHSSGQSTGVLLISSPTHYALSGNDSLILQTLADMVGMANALFQREEEKLSLEQQLHHNQKMESLGVLAGGVAHDFNNILAVIMCYSSLGQQKPENAAEFMPEIEKAAERAAGLCRQMLAYAGKTQFVESSVDLTALLDDMLNMLKSTLPTNVNIKPYLTGDVPPVQADASQLRLIIMNMMINASEAIGEEQGDICVALTKSDITAEKPEKDHFGKIIKPGPYVCLEISDTGGGMDEETKKRIFEPFYTTKFVGRGLGMSALLGTVTSHNGALQLFSKPGHGATFKVYFPVHDVSGSAETPAQSDGSHWKGSGTILLVEDEPQLITVAKGLLESFGFSVIEATNGIEALEQYQKRGAEIMLVVTDIGMPLMGGYTLIKELKKLDPALPIIVSSGYSDTAITSKIDLADVAGLISKPYNFDQLMNVLREVVESGGR